ncbi:AC4 [Tomato mosaic Havana virus-[Quivican]]|uniref:AC4 protein n=1 Tax=Tomato mosaic Havana virus-[Quivican] TaxID=223357 RepID=O91200_9GEMI|nr:AC4 [Tomato mosaic Havana virus-[Quivican]]CAA75137.1 AC4 [Tomato mosaic Havana virus-[Quivican]]
MGSLISMCFCSSKPNTSARIADSSTWSPHPGQHISIRTYRELSRAPTSRHTSTRTEMRQNGGNSRSTVDLLEEAASRPTIHMQRH